MLKGTMATWISPGVLAAFSIWSRNPFAAVLSALILVVPLASASFMEPVLSRTRVILSFVLPQVTVVEDPIGIWLIPITRAMVEFTLAVPAKVRLVPVGS